ncbi:hypothetical protein IEI94_03460 [Halomonas sp. ML-15]|uniref:hypothetical protein n=1 Tax=Halomonas sp. ML-15 TaxID=2773305 RepID=UPI00174796C2|nr:hypothetical protein [Halomonas sp. ML-15]MBD3894909.1 hypothetical protein [Halomonas sp. ML-15]
MVDLIPNSYDEWRYCITEICGISLTESYIRKRINALNDQQDFMTARFIELYGEAHHQQTLAWFEQALGEVA